MRRLILRAPLKSSGYIAPQVTPHTFLAAIWALTALSLIFLPARLYARWKTLGRFYWDDLFVTLAWSLSLAISISVTVYNDVTYDIMYIGAGQKPFPSNVKIITMEFTRLFTVALLTFYTGIWSVKVAFLLFFRRLGTRNIKSLQRWWWIVAVITASCYVVCLAILPYRCTLVSFKVTASRECQTQGLSFISMKVSCVLDVFTDALSKNNPPLAPTVKRHRMVWLMNLAVVSIPFLILRRIRVSRRQMVALSIVFSLVVVTILFAVVRATLTTAKVKKQIDPVWMYMWSSIELNVAIIVACVAPYRTLFLRERTPIHAHRPHQSLKAKAFKIFTSSERTESGQRGETCSTAGLTELPYLAPWPEENVVANGQAEHNTKAQNSKLPQNYHHCQEPWMTAELPYLEPWHENGRQELYQQIRNEPDTGTLSTPARAHVRNYHSTP